MSNTEEVVRRSKSKTEIFNNLSKEDVEKYQEAFAVSFVEINISPVLILSLLFPPQVWDKNSSGRISMAELSDMLENLGKKPTEVGIKNKEYKVQVSIKLLTFREI